MDVIIDPPAQKLMQAFMQFNKAHWHRRTILGFRPSEIRVLFCIKKGIHADSSGMKISEISKHLQVTAPSITQLTKSLEANGLIERHFDPTDRRIVGIKLTEKGETITQQAANTFTVSMSGLIDYLGEEKSNQLAELLASATRYFNEEAPGVEHTDCNEEELG